MSKEKIKAKTKNEIILLRQLQQIEKDYEELLEINENNIKIANDNAEVAEKHYKNLKEANQTITLQQKVIELMAESLSYYQNIALERGEKHKISAEWLLNYYTQKAKENLKQI